MKKSDLKTGMVVEYYNGGMRMVLKDTPHGDIITNGTLWSPLSFYSDDLTCEVKSFHIVAVYKPKREFQYMSFKRENLECIWKRPEPVKEISAEEAFKILKDHYGCDVKITSQIIDIKA